MEIGSNAPTNEHRSAIAAVLLLIPLGLFTWWMIAAHGVTSQADAVTRFLEPLPRAFQSPSLLTTIFLACCAAAVVIALYNARHLQGRKRTFNSLTMVLALILSAWAVFGLL